LASVARKLAEGESPAPLTPTTADEVGQLTRTFNMMTQALKERSLAITSNLETIHRQVTQLTTVHQTSAAITSTLDLNELLDTVLQLLMNNLGLPRMVLMLRHEDTNMAYVAQIAGVPPEIAQRARTLVVPIEDDGTIMAELFVHAKPVLVEDIDAAAHRMHQVVLDLARRTGVRSFVCVPLQTRTQILGFLAGDRGEQVCTAEDLDILLTIAGHVATAIDNARTYANLEALTLNLERRVQEATQELVAANERLQEHDKRRSLFFSVASHELRTPMTAIRSFTDNMLDGVAGPLTEHQTTYLKRIGHNLNRLTRIINQLLDWSRFDLQKETLRIEPLCVGKIAELVAESLRTIAVEKHVEIDVTVQDGLPVIEGDRDKLEQIFWNLIGNAVKFTPEGGRIVVAASTAPDNRVQVSVSDTGCGIAPDALEHVFDEFSKVPSAMPNAQGAQLGLYITKSLVTLHHGTIDVTSVLNGGSRFIVTLPLTQPREEAAESSAPGPAPESQGTAS
jgi:signal transduction histidine kinase